MLALETGESQALFPCLRKQNDRFALSHRITDERIIVNKKN
jgi:hypothetical protein